MKIQVYSANVGQHDPFRKEENGLRIFYEDKLDNSLLSARFYKCIPHLLFPESRWTIWIDANVWLNVSPEELVYKAKETGKDFGVFQHTWHKNVFEERDMVLMGGYDSNNRVASTLRRWGNDVDQNNHAMTMVLVRKNTEDNMVRNMGWWQDICYGSRRDQLSFGLHYPGPYWETVDFTQPNKYFTRVT